MISFKTTSTFRRQIEKLLKARRNVYGSVINEIKSALNNVPIEQIRMNRDMILMEDDILIIKLRLPDKKQKLSIKDGYRLVYLVSKVDNLVVFLYIYPKNGPLQQLDIDNKEVEGLVAEYNIEADNMILEDFVM